MIDFKPWLQFFYLNHKTTAHVMMSQWLWGWWNSVCVCHLSHQLWHLIQPPLEIGHIVCKLSALVVELLKWCLVLKKGQIIAYSSFSTYCWWWREDRQVLWRFRYWPQKLLTNINFPVWKNDMLANNQASPEKGRKQLVHTQYPLDLKERRRWGTSSSNSASNVM